MNNLLQLLPNLEYDEMVFLQNETKDYTEQQLRDFAGIYSARRKDPMLVLITALVGFLGISGIQRFLLGQIGMGILYLLTGGLCFIGTIIDLVNYKKLAFEYNINEARMAASMVKGF